ncbi:hypothetical protein C5O27_06700 [Gordonia alkanivorans]|uniref:phage portal protein n=1 Tax=Gordonia alkanivorans TaxID=84096 RepID=UPI000FDEA8E0|nr:phage portal protein [Gordonia alkanivorans]AZZ80793.1 hypothetical protein C5O27_06700 [Gordonia alkanivorans]
MRWPWQPTTDSRRIVPLDETLTHDTATVLDKSAGELFAEPHLRTVVDFLVRNVAQLGLHVFRRDGDGGRERVRGSKLAELLAQPNPSMTINELVYAIVGVVGVACPGAGVGRRG